MLLKLLQMTHRTNKNFDESLISRFEVAEAENQFELYSHPSCLDQLLQQQT